MPVRLTGAKSRVGHSEPVAGLVGLANMAAMLGNQRAHAIMHLRQVRVSAAKSSMAAAAAAAFTDGCALTC